MQTTRKIWLDGKLVDWQKAKIHILTHTLHYGAGVFEGIRFYDTKAGPAVFKLKEHLDRLFFSAGCLKMKIPFSKEEIRKAIKNLIKINKIREGYIRPIIYFGYGIMGLNPKKAPVNCAIAVWPWSSYLGEKAVKVKISKFIRIHPRSTFSQAKICGHYVNSIFASMEAKEKGFDEALLLDYQRNVAEGPGENIFMVKNKTLITPAPGSILAGITRKTIIQLAKDLSYKVKEKRITPSELKKADELFFCGTAAEVTAIKQLDDKVISKGKIGPVTEILKNEYLKIVHGKNEKYQHWLDYVYTDNRKVSSGC